ncbi:MAG: AEC family transporter [Clostridium sp.]|jgi:predicted permease|nr:AEC family transporter [Clostridium sp.]
MILLQQMIVLFLLMAVGFLCRKKRLIDEEASKRISGLVINVANPAMILSAGFRKENAVTGGELAGTFLLAAVIFGILIGTARFLPRLLSCDREDYGVYRVMTVFSNIGFMGFPIIRAVYGQEALLYASVFLLPYNILIYTYGIQAVKPRSRKEPLPWTKIGNIGVYACLVCMALYILNIPVPVFLQDAVGHLSALTAPLSMLVIGGSLAGQRFRSLFSDKRLLAFSAVKLLLIPLVGVSVIKLLGFAPMLTGVCLVVLSAPVGSMIAMLARQYDGDFELASKGMALTTVLSVATLPLLSLILQV